MSPRQKAILACGTASPTRPVWSICSGAMLICRCSQGAFSVTLCASHPNYRNPRSLQTSIGPSATFTMNLAGVLFNWNSKFEEIW